MAQISGSAWLNEATFCELVSMGFKLPTLELSEAVSGGEYADAAAEIAALIGLDEDLSIEAVALLRKYEGRDAEALFHDLRAEFTRLYVGVPEPAVYPYAGIWWADENDVQPLLFVNKRSMDVEHFMGQYGVGQAKGKNYPLDHISTMFEFLQYVAAVNAEAVVPPEGVAIPEDAYGEFITRFMADWVSKFADATTDSTREGFYHAMALLLNAYMASH